jgi:hypothetical protein
MAPVAIQIAPVRAVYLGRPVLVAASLADLHGPAGGTVELPLHLFWSAPDATFNLDEPGTRRQLYETVVREARHPGDLARYLDGDTLIGLWPAMHLPRRVKQAWEEQHPALRAASPAAA